MGVSLCKQTGKWASSIIVDARMKGKKRFLNFEEAVQHRRELEIKYEFHANHNKSLIKAGENIIALNATQLTAKKVRLAEQLSKVVSDIEAKIEGINKAHEERIVALNEANDIKVQATRNGIVARKETLETQIDETDVLIQEQVATLQAQIDAIKGASEAIQAPVVDTENDSEDLV